MLNPVITIREICDAMEARRRSLKIDTSRSPRIAAEHTLDAITQVLAIGGTSQRGYLGELASELWGRQLDSQNAARWNALKPLVMRAIA
jgi:hypothetical protein